MIYDAVDGFLEWKAATENLGREGFTKEAVTQLSIASVILVAGVLDGPTNLADDVIEAGVKVADDVALRSKRSINTQDDVVTLWKAPQGGRSSISDEILEGFDPKRYKLDGPFFSLEKKVAQKYQFHYQNGLQEFNILRSDYDDLLQSGIIRIDPLEEASIHVPASGLRAFNEVLKRGPRNFYHPQ